MRHSIAILTISVILTLPHGLSGADQGSAVRVRFLSELKNRRIQSKVLDDGRIELEHAGKTLYVSLENLERNVARDNRADAVERFIDRALSATSLPAEWEKAKSGVRFSAESMDSELGDVAWDAVSKEVRKVAVWVNEAEDNIMMIPEGQPKEWGITRAELFQVAAANMSVMLASTPIEVSEIDGAIVGMLASESALKASLVLSPNLRQAVSTKIGWPILAMIPCRDFVFLIRESDKELLSRLGSTIVSEFKKSGYPITTEILRIGDDGVRAIGAFPVNELSNEE